MEIKKFLTKNSSNKVIIKKTIYIGLEASDHLTYPHTLSLGLSHKKINSIPSRNLE